MPVISNWKVTWDPAGTPLVFLDYEEEIERELSMPWEQAHEVRQVIEGAFSEPLPRSHVTGSLSFTRWKDHATNAAAFDYLRTHRADCHALRGLRKTLRITPLDGTDDDKANTMLKSADGRVLDTDEERSITVFTYTFLGPW